MIRDRCGPAIVDITEPCRFRLTPYRREFPARRRPAPRHILQQDLIMSNLHNTILISTAIVASLPVVPIAHYLRFGWAARKRQIVDRLPEASIAHYKDTFCPMGDFEDSAGFAREYDLRYGRRLFVFPVTLFCVAIYFLTYLSACWVLPHDWSSADEGTAKIAILSLAGAYVWITYDLIIRARQNDIVTSDVNRATLRLLVSLPFGFAVSAFAGVLPDSQVTLTSGALAFFVGAFPTETVLKFMRRTAAIPLKLDADSNGDNVQQLTKIDGISVPIAERLIDEGVKTNLQLAYSDPVALTIKSGMDFSFILDICGQALVRLYFNDDQMRVVQKFGLRTGVEIRGLNDPLAEYDEDAATARAAGRPDPPPSPEQAAAQTQLQNFATALVLDRDSTRFILDQIAGDRYTTFAWDVWAV
jgi:hypothetical protein